MMPTPCCGYKASGVPYPVFFNEFNGVVCCHNCGHTYEPSVVQSFKTYPYSVLKFDFAGLVARQLEVPSLYTLHGEHEEQFKVGSDSATKFHHKFYTAYHKGWPEMEDMYKAFIMEVIAPLYSEDFLYQKFPTFRVHLPGNVAVGEFHTDADFGHPPGEVNYIIPLTDAMGTASVWLESSPAAEDFKAMDMKVGQLIQFNGNQLTHGNLINKTGKSRVSMDFRVLPLSCYDEATAKVSVTQKARYVDGDYYRRYVHGPCSSLHEHCPIGEKQAAIVNAAIAWWLEKQPARWTNQEHRVEYGHGCASLKELEIAEAVVAYLNFSKWPASTLV